MRAEQRPQTLEQIILVKTHGRRALFLLELRLNSLTGQAEDRIPSNFQCWRYVLLGGPRLVVSTLASILSVLLTIVIHLVTLLDLQSLKIIGHYTPK